jgi:putative cardiolipin synthase
MTTTSKCRTLVAGLVLVGGAIVMVSCSNLPSGHPKTVSTAFPSPSDTEVGGVFEREARRHPGKSGFAIIAGNREAFTGRVALARFAEKSLDIQYFIWSADTIGQMLGAQIVDAAERGVRVRFLLDDINFKKRDSAIAAVSAHPNVEVRIFNPARHRSLRGLEFVSSFSRLNRRMHNKIMVMDNACAIVGGRNIADEYFGLGEKQNNRDLDIVATGPIVREISNSFDEFWNSAEAVPIESLVGKEFSMEDFSKRLEVMRSQIHPERYPFPLESDLATLRKRIDQMQLSLLWAPGRVMHDSIRSMESDEGPTLHDDLSVAISTAKSELLIESAYFVMTDDGLEMERELTGRGVKIRVLTNSLASNNVIAAQAGHSKRRKELVRAGVDLFEFRPDAECVRSTVAPQGRESTTTLHTKALVIDETRAFVGSYNLDPRSASINSEIGIMVESDVFARQVKAFLDQGVDPENAYHVVEGERGRLRWEATIGGQEKIWSEDPETSVVKRMKAGVISLLPIQNQL